MTGLADELNFRSSRVRSEDADRQVATVREIVRRLSDDEQPGLILADDVGMGKTYVALGVAAHYVVENNYEKQIIVLVPPGVRHKWPRDWSEFTSLLPAGVRSNIRATPSTLVRASQVLSTLDDGADTRAHIVFATHGAMSLSFRDPWMGLAVLVAATRRRHDGANARRTIALGAADLFYDTPFSRRGADGELIISRLVDRPFAEWKRLWNSALDELDGTKGERDARLDDDPVPMAVQRALEKSSEELQEGWDLLCQRLPKNSQNFSKRMKKLRGEFGGSSGVVARALASSLEHLDLASPLLIVDEAHHLRRENRLGRLLSEASDGGPATQGIFNGCFSKMLFLTATPFQLDTVELGSVLSRMELVDWKSCKEGAVGIARQKQAELIASLNQMRDLGTRFQQAWAGVGPLSPHYLDDEHALRAAIDSTPGLNYALTLLDELKTRKAETEQLLRGWVIRHQRPDMANGVARRQRFPGIAITDMAAANNNVIGLPVTTGAVMPFLLAARLNGVIRAAAETNESALGVSTFALGLSSSFEAYRNTKRAQSAAAEATGDLVEGDAPEERADLEVDHISELPDQLRWYIDHINASLPLGQAVFDDPHPKVQVTVQKAADLWAAGEKCLVFCFYFQTGRALRVHISREIRRRIAERSRAERGMPDATLDDGAVDEEFALLDRLSDRFDSDAAAGIAVIAHATEICRAGNAERSDEVLTDAEIELIASVTLRFVRTRSWMVRYFDIGELSAEAELSADRARQLVAKAFRMSGAVDGDGEDISGGSLGDRVRAFGTFLRQRNSASRAEILAALKELDTGDMVGRASASGDSESFAGVKYLANVRLVNGGSPADLKKRVADGFNSPFFPEVLIASAVMAEGVDLHVDCRHVIHHDLDWNPAVLAQRTGRVDRIGSKAERVGRPIEVFEPFIAGTYDEKQYRVVSDRERWFQAVMGGRPFDVNELMSGSDAEVNPLPSWLVERLRFDLTVR